MISLALVWTYSPLSYYADPEILLDKISNIRNKNWMPLVVISSYLISAIIFFPVTVLNIICALIYKPIISFIFSLVCCLLSATLSYLIGSKLGRKGISKISGKNFDKLKSKIPTEGVFKIAIFRNIPVMPFSMFNMAAGALRVPLHIFLLGSLFGMAPGLLIIALTGSLIK